MLFDDTNIIDELQPLKEEDVEAQPCDEKAFQWCCRTFTLVIVSLFLLSMTLVAASQYSAALSLDDTERPVILAMGNTCRDTTWNCDRLGIYTTYGQITYEVNYFEGAESYDYTYLDSTCKEGNVSFPYIFITVEAEKCCRFVLYNTI